MPSQSSVLPAQPQELDTCRICRGDASEDEPLFHPCKCSGSIMFVHQDCLMEWLSHSQKKHCELCKTPFTFTKLYHPEMPTALPTAIFLRKAVGHAISKVLFWGRGSLVAVTWLFWLPWTMRFVWWALFWLADLGWIYDAHLHNGTMPADLALPLLNATNSSQIGRTAFDHIVHGPAIYSLIVWFTSTPPYSLIFPAHSASTPNLTDVSNMTTPEFPALRSRDTLLSGVQFVSHPVANRILTDVFEGLLITMALVAAIVLVLLIREWVVQQQPIINMVADENNPDAAAAAPRHDAPEPAPDDTGNDEPPELVVPDNAESGSDGDDHDESEGPADSHAASEKLRSDETDDVEDVLDVDVSLATHSNVVQLCTDLRTNHTELRLFDRADLQNLQRWDSRARSKQQMAVLVIKTHETELALEKLARHAAKEADSATFLQVSESLDCLDGALQFLSDGEAEALRHRVSDARALIELLSSNAIKPNSETVPSSPTTQDQARASTDSARSNLAPESSTRARPSMPGRDESFLATEIQRRLQETQPPDSNSDPESFSRPLVVNQASSSNSEGSWQVVDDAPAEPEIVKRVVEPEHIADRDSLHPIEANSSQSERPGPRSDFWKRRPFNARRNSTDLSANLAAAADPTDDSALRDDSQLPLEAIIGESSPGDIMIDPEKEPFPSLDPLDPDESQDDPDYTGQAAPGAAGPRPPSLFQRSVDWLWGDIAPPDDIQQGQVNDEHVIDDINEEAPFVAFVPEQQAAQVAEDHHNHGHDHAVGRPALVPDEAEMVDDAEELEGVMELIGMQGPLAGLFTNALFAAVFVSCTTTLAIWLPFLFGKLVLVWVAHPLSLGELVFQAASGLVNILVDCSIYLLSHGLQYLLDIPLVWLAAWRSSQDRFDIPVLGSLARLNGRLLNSSYSRLAGEVKDAYRSTNEASSHLTLDSHAALSHIKSQVSSALNDTASAALVAREHLAGKSWASFMASGSIASIIHNAMGHTKNGTRFLIDLSWQAPRFLWSGQLTITHKAIPADMHALEQVPNWTATDRSLAIGIGYIALATMAAIYFTRIAPIATSREGRRIENIVLEILQQTGGITKVVLIISIEMLAFPLYCGLLLDFAMLPLFGSATIESRVRFTMNSPWTSIFVHWFIGTCYMFHFALFVAMCRKILRKGVLYFIRDPDDPTFHPVRDVLERSVVSQLRKIASSALIYGGLVVVCLGSVLWVLAYGISGVLPIKWTSGNGFFGFPVDLLLYTSLKPLLIKFFAPSDWLHNAYDWWFQRCARALRLSHYLFGLDNEDERGYKMVIRDGVLVKEPSSMTGKWARVPNNDQVRIGKGSRAWIEVDENNHRTDGIAEPDEVPGVGPNDTNFTKVYTPPHFRLRIMLFVACLWALTAGAGFALTVLPLLCGRSLFAVLLPSTLWANDIYAFSIGLFTICGAAYVAIKAREATSNSTFSLASFRHALATSYVDYGATLSNRAGRSLRCLYVYGCLAVVVPTLFALVAEFYVLAPVHTWLTQGAETHTVELLHSWTLGVQYMRVAMSAIQWDPESRAAQALRAVTARGYSDPDAGKATRYFFLPITVASIAVLAFPMPLGLVAASVAAEPGDEANHRLISSLAFPAVLAAALFVLGLRWIVRLLSTWRMRIRDEVYLIGERLHNYGEKTAPKVKTA